MLIYYALNVTHKCNYNVTQKSRSDRVKARVRISPILTINNIYY